MAGCRSEDGDGRLRWEALRRALSRRRSTIGEASESF